jgi:hypothetical protein
MGSPFELATVPSIEDPEEQVIVIRTSDRYTFRRCRRLWGWISHLKLGLQLREEPVYFWFGSGFHWALEDFHGYNTYGHAGKAFLAYVEGCRQCGELPPGWEEHVPLGLGMLSYYSDYWLRNRSPLSTLWMPCEDGGPDVPQVEVNTQIDLGVRHKGRRVVYGCTLDRMSVDEYGRLWIHEYKTAKNFSLYHLDLDEQVTAYCWAAQYIYGELPAGCVYLQFRKHVPRLPRILATGELSIDKRQPTTAALFRASLLDMFGDMEQVPSKYMPFLNQLTVEEEEEADRFIRRDHVERNQHQVDAFEELVHMELEDMLREDLPLYPNKVRDCIWNCPLQVPCLAMDDGSDYEGALGAYLQRGSGQFYFNEELTWRKALPPPDQVELPPEAEVFSNLLQESQGISKEGSESVKPEQAFLEELYSGRR